MKPMIHEINTRLVLTGKEIRDSHVKAYIALYFLLTCGNLHSVNRSPHAIIAAMKTRNISR